MSVGKDVSVMLGAIYGVQRVWFDMKPDQDIAGLIVVGSYPGRDPQYTHDGPANRIDVPRFQIMTRDMDAEAAESLNEEVQSLLCISNQWINGTWYQSITPTTPPSFLDRDERGRTSYTSNYEALRSRGVVSASYVVELQDGIGAN